jgi:hypothetical protein
MHREGWPTLVQHVVNSLLERPGVDRLSQASGFASAAIRGRYGRSRRRSLSRSSRCGGASGTSISQRIEAAMERRL